MISEVQFARLFTSVWADLMPTGEQFVRRVNSYWSQRFRPPLVSTSAPAKRSAISEAAFRYFELRIQRTVGAVTLGSEALGNAIRWAEGRAPRFVDFSPFASPEFDTAAIDEVKLLAHRLEDFFLMRCDARELVVSPQFIGCGIVDACAGDVLAASILYEVKAGDRPYRSIDLRQLLTYAALNYANKQTQIDRVGLFNPRMGTFFEMELDSICEEVGGVGATELLGRIVYTLSSGEISA